MSYLFRNGSINQPHFAHYKSIHKDAKLLMKKLLQKLKIINFYLNS